MRLTLDEEEIRQAVLLYVNTKYVERTDAACVDVKGLDKVKVRVLPNELMQASVEIPEGFKLKAGG